MSWRAYYDSATGVLFSEGSGGWPATTPPGWAYREYPERPEIGQWMWNEATKDFIARPPKVLVDRLEDLINNPNYADFLAVWNALNATRKAQIRAALIRLLGNHRFRNPGETTEIP